MDEEKRARVDSFLEEALSRSGLERAAFLEKTSREDDEIGREVSSLARSFERAGSFLLTPAPGCRRLEPESPRSTFAPGDLLSGRFEIVQLRACGGMGEVYEAVDVRLQESVALKTIRLELAWDEKAVARFLREVHVARKVTHRNVCRIHDVFHEGREGSEDILFLTMELLPGETLASYLEREGRIDWREALPILTQILSGLEAAFSVGVLHRDLKAENVMLVPEAEGVRAVVTDFGLAVVAGTDPGPPGPEGLSRPWGASSRLALGTPAYMSPEQLRGEVIDHCSDIFSFGVIAYEMLSGENPYPIACETEPLGRRFESKPRSLREFERRIPRDLDRSVLQSLEVEPSDRPKDASELRRKLGATPTMVPARRVALLGAASAIGGAFVLIKTGPAMLELLERWVGGPRVLPLEDYVNSPKALEALRTGLAKVCEGANLNAIPFLKAAVREDPDSTLPRVFLMDVLLNVGEENVVEEMEGRLRETTASSTVAPASELSRAVLARSDGDYTAASEILSTLTATYPDDLNLVLSRARIAEEAGDMPEAQRLYEDVRSESPAATLGLCRCLTIIGELQNVISILSTLLSSGGLGDDPEVLGMAHSILGIARRDQGLPGRAIESFEQALNYRERANDRRGQVASMTHLGSAYRMVGRLKDSISVLEKALGIAQAMGDRIYESQALYTLARSIDLVGRTEDAIAAARQSLDIELARQDHAEIPQRLTFLAIAHRRRGQYGEAQVLLDRGREHTRRSGDREVEAYRLLTLASVQIEQGKYDQANEVLARVVIVSEAVREPSAADATIALAGICDVKGDYREAERLGLEALSLLERFPTGAELARALAWKSQHLIHLGDFGASRDAIKEARENGQRLHLREPLMALAVLDAEIVGHTHSLEQAARELESTLLQTEANEFAFLSIRTRLALGRIYWRLGRTEDALAVLHGTADVASTANTLPLLAAAEISLGEVLLSDGDPGEASERVMRGLDAAESCGTRPLLRQAAVLLGEASARLGRDRESAQFLTKARQLHLDIVSRVPPTRIATYLEHPDVQVIVAKLHGLTRGIAGV
jgi:tetratricopeptide (TPR) repeat protein